MKPTSTLVKAVYYAVIVIGCIAEYMSPTPSWPAIAWAIVSGVWMSVAFTYHDMYAQLYNFITTKVTTHDPT